ncbi:MAG: hydantoinase B/oxoprolinase family protein, partial [Caulobacteraceae bacterium]|nr:hydantoinase B/oxoprolinase family protein [Caulobacter sp.]
DAAAGDLLCWVAARGHHADVGGLTPGSMPPDSRTIADEGALFDNLLVVDGATGALQEDDVRAVLAAGAHPARNPDENLADLRAQLAACAKGAAALRALYTAHGRAGVDAYMGHLQHAAEAAVRRRLPELADGAFRYEMDDGAVIAVALRVDREAGRLAVDFTGTSPQRPTNFNAPRAITRAAVLYWLRTLVAADVPLNDGALRPVELVIPPGCMLDPRPPGAVVAGNVETSQAITDALYGALLAAGRGVVAASQGTMNNLTFGDGARQYYETICGGAGAGPGFAGASAVQTHMTNSRLTDPEVLETRFPVRVERFAVRRGSGGAGAWRGGDGVERRLVFTAPATASILSGHRRVAPFGGEGGGEGALGDNRLERADGRVEPLAGVDRRELAPGDALVILTPGGGGWGRSEDSG